MEGIEIKLKHPKCMPVQATEGSSGYDVIAYDITFIEAITSEMIKTEKQLGTTNVPIQDAVTNRTSFIEKEQVYELNTLYRCLVDTGIEVASIPKGYEIQVRPSCGLS